jgi:hypothetical protein
MKAISLWQPWAWAILHAGKDVENRVWRTIHRGPLLLHAAKRRVTQEEAENFVDLLDDILGARRVSELLPIGSCYDTIIGLPKGGIVGRVDVVGCRRGVESPWAFSDQYQWIVENPTPLPFKAVKGERGFFEVDYEGLVEPLKKQTELF